ncbi:hypothetical protein ANO11243_008690 [Dothideomycetidae sp. 11243]|nr:hypothetical protein ANO11243_008690 [fungal sp. No.11243]
MKTVNLAFTAPINPPETSPKLSTPQVWAGLQRKVRHAPEFVPAIGTCRVLSDSSDPDDGTVEREVTFAADPEHKIKEKCVSAGGLKVDFHQPDGGLITNYISEGEGGELFLTYTFQIVSDLKEGSEERKAFRDKQAKMARMAVLESINSIRKMVKEGKL